MSKHPAGVLFLGKADDAHVSRALDFCRANFAKVDAVLGKWGDPKPPCFATWKGEYIFSFLSRWVLPGSLLDRAEKAALNFHPATPDYPGIGCNNFALYENAPTYGATCHHMKPKVDTGDIVAVTRFPVFESDGVASILARTYDHQLVLFYDIVGGIVQGRELPRSTERWTRRPFTRTELDELGRITPDMSREEIARRLRATRFGAFKPQVTIQGFTFELKD